MFASLARLFCRHLHSISAGVQRHTAVYKARVAKIEVWKAPFDCCVHASDSQAKVLYHIAACQLVVTNIVS